MQFHKYVTHPNCSSSLPLFGVGPMLQLDVAIFILNISTQQQFHGEKFYRNLNFWENDCKLGTYGRPSLTPFPIQIPILFSCDFNAFFGLKGGFGMTKDPPKGQLDDAVDRPECR